MKYNSLMFLTLLLSFSLQAAQVLVIGDSHTVGPFGWSLDENLRREGFEVATYGSCGSIAAWWMNGGVESKCGYFARNLEGARIELKVTPKLELLLSQGDFDAVVLQFGGNYVHYSDEFILKDVNFVVDYLQEKSLKCFWVSNPDGRSNRHLSPRILKLLTEALANRCPLFNSHLVNKLSASWRRWDSLLVQRRHADCPRMGP